MAAIKFLFLFAWIPLISCRQINFLPLEEVRAYLNDTFESDTDYEVVSLVHTLHKRSLSPTMRIRAFQEDIELYLEPNENFLFGKNTPVYLSYSDIKKNIVYKPFEHNADFTLYHDLANKAAIMVEKNENGHRMYGTIGNYMLRPWTENMHSSIRKRRSTNSKNSLIAKDDETFADDHVIIKIKKDLNEKNADFKSSTSNGFENDIKFSSTFSTSGNFPNTDRNGPTTGWKFEWNTMIRSNMNAIKEDLIVTPPTNLKVENREIIDWNVIMKYVDWDRHLKSFDFNKIIKYMANPESNQLSMEMNVKVKNDELKSSKIPVEFDEAFFKSSNTFGGDTFSTNVEWTNLWYFATNNAGEIHFNVFVEPPKDQIQIFYNKNWNIVMNHINWNQHLKTFDWVTKIGATRELKLKLTVLLTSNLNIPKNTPQPPTTKRPMIAVPSTEDPTTTIPGKTDSTKKDYVYPQILVVADHKYFKKIGGNVNEFIKYQAVFWNGVDLLYRYFENPTIRLNIAGIVISQESSADHYSKYVNGDMLYYHPSLSILQENFFPENYEYPFDIVVALTDYTLSDISSRPDSQVTLEGVAQLGGACTSRSIALVRDRSNFNGIRTATHELGHLFGAPHDFDSICSTYVSKTEYIMSYDSVTENQFRWSSCSLKFMRDFFRSDTATCLRNQPIVSSPYPKFMPGSIASVDAQCDSRWSGSKAVVNGNKQSVCHRLDCYKITTHVNGYTTSTLPGSEGAIEGSPCENGGICLQGDCVPIPKHYHSLLPTRYI